MLLTHVKSSRMRVVFFRLALVTFVSSTVVYKLLVCGIVQLCYDVSKTIFSWILGDAYKTVHFLGSSCVSNVCKLR